jgi:general secretion pathway protein M
MRRLPTSRDYLSRAAAAGLLLLLLLGVDEFVLEPYWRAWSEAQESIAASRTLLAGFQRSAAERPGLESQLRALDGSTVPPQPGLIEATNAPLAAAGLQSSVKAIFETAGGQVRSVQDLPTTRIGSFHQVTIRLDVAVATEGLQKALYRIESSQPYMFVDNLAIRAPEPQRMPGPRPAGNELSVRLEVYGYIRAAAP